MDLVNYACSNQDTLNYILSWVGTVTPVMSVVTWLTAKWGKIPEWLQRTLQVAAGNALHAALGEPKKVP